MIADSPPKQLASEPTGAPGSAGDTTPLGRRLYWGLFVANGVVNGLLLWYFHRRFWYPPDDGIYAHVAQRLLDGEVLHLHVQDVHPGYINFTNAAALGLFGPDLLSLRYPLVLAALAQACLLFLLFDRRRPGAALIAAVTLTVLGVVQFLNPTAHWYCLFLVIAVACSLKWLPKGTSSRLIVVGVLLGVLALFRQLSGAIAALGVVSHLLIEARGTARGKDVLLERLVVSALAAGLCLYLLSATNLAGGLLFGLWPLLILGWLWSNAATASREVGRIILCLSLGGVIAASPLLLYHWVNGSLGPWLDDTVWVAAALTRLSFFEQSSYGWLPLAGLVQIRSGSVGEVLNGAYWFTLPLVPALNGILVLRSLMRHGTMPVGWGGGLPLLAVFYSLVSLHYQIPIYLYYTVGLSFASLLLLSAERGRLRFAFMALCLTLSCLAVHFHAGQPLSRGWRGMLAGQRVTLVPAKPLPRCGLWIEASERDRYLALVSLIQRETRPDETIFALPSNAELYFLSGRRNPFRFYNSALGVRDDDSLRRVERALLDQPPKLVIFNPLDKYNTPFSMEIMRTVRDRYALVRNIDGFEIYRSRDPASRRP